MYNRAERDKRSPSAALRLQLHTPRGSKSNNLCAVICYSDNIEKVGALFEENDDGTMRNEPKPLTSAFLITNGTWSLK
jgi:hypothetical protein